MKHGVQKLMSVLLTLCMVMAMCSFASAQTAAADFEALLPLMDVVCAASQYSPNAPENVGGADSELSASFVDAFFKVGQKMGTELGITADTLQSTDAQAELIGKIFAAKAPALQMVEPLQDEIDYIGFHPVTVNSQDAGSVQIIGEMYVSSKPMRQMTNDDYLSAIKWIDRAVFTFQSDANAMNGYRLMAFAVGTDLSLESAMQNYFEEIAVEYESKLGFTLLYPAVFADELLVEDENGVSAAVADGSASFFAKRFANTNATSLSDYVTIVSNGISGSIANVNEEMQYGTVTYTTDDGFAVFNVFVVTEEYIYQAELRYSTALMSEYAMYNAYLENSFVVSELSQG